MQKNHTNPNAVQKEFLEEAKRFLVFKMKCYCPVHKVEDYQQILLFEQKIMEAASITGLKNLYHEIYNFGIYTIVSSFCLFPFYDFLKNIKAVGLRGIKEEQLINFLFSMAQSKKPTTLYKYAIFLRTFFNFLDRKRGFNFDFLLKNLSFLDARDRFLPKHLDKDQLIKFIKTLSSYQPKKSYEKRNKVILLMVVLGGLRSSETFNLKLRDIKIEDENLIINIFGKGRKERKICIKRSFLQDALNDWLEDSRRLIYFSGEFLFKKGFSTKPQRKINLTNFIKKIYKKAGIIDTNLGMGLHIFRHSFATFLYAETNDLLLTSRTLGHQTIESTKIYIHTNVEQNKKTATIFDRYL